MIKKTLAILTITAFSITNPIDFTKSGTKAFAAGGIQYPNTSGQVLFEFKSDQILKTNAKNVPANNSYFNIEPDIALNIDENWSIKTGWRILPTMQRNYTSPEKTRTILRTERGFNENLTDLVVEELKVNFQNDDMKFFAGKINPTFATMYRKTKRIGVFVTDFTEEYELREKIGFGAAALLEDSEINFNTFFNDVSGLSGSALNNRSSERTNDGIAGNTSTLSSYTVTMEGQKLFGKENLFYNFGYRSLGIKNNNNNKRETGYTLNLEYLYKLGHETSLVPLIEIVKIKNFTGLANRDAQYITTSLVAKYSRWTVSVTDVFRNISNNYPAALSSNSRDNQIQFSAGYKFTNNLAIDISRANIKENGHTASLLGVIFSYLYKF